MKVRTGVVFSNKDVRNDDYIQFLQNEDTVKYCSKFSSDVFKLSYKWNDILGARKLLKSEAQEIKNLEQNNKEGLSKYLEHLILDNHNYEFIIPYYLLGHERDNSDINHHKNDNFGMLGNVHDILSSEV